MLSISRGETEGQDEGGAYTETGPGAVRWQDYFCADVDEPEVGRPREVTTKVQKFRGTLWLCEDYPLQLQEQIMPILELMATLSSPHFTKLKDFVQMQLPAGFPVKIEIPLFHVLNARITFMNIFGTTSPVAGVATLQEAERLSCLVDDDCFRVGSGYRETGGPGDHDDPDDEELMHFAVRQSLMEPGTQCDQVDVWEALRGARPSPAPSPRPSSPAPAAAPRDADLLRHEQTMLQRAIEESLAIARAAGSPPLAG
ncbi:ankyrin repeat domain-containing protein 13D-like, partial [Leptidea sinapis]|uniref:ankyrin repeat domain-containing protein 13D-like n=1 Tax=Leptidea sinapis TaxID=189913 RepID=UPI0021C3C70F